MTAGVVDLTIDAKAGYEITFTYCNPIVGFPGDAGPPINVTGYHARMTIRSSYGDGAALTLDDASLGGITVGTTDGVFQVAMTAEQTDQLPSRGVYDLLVTPPVGEPIRLVQGSVVTNPGATK